MTYEEILAELDQVTTLIALTDPNDESFSGLCDQQERLIREMNSHPDNRKTM